MYNMYPRPFFLHPYAHVQGSRRVSIMEQGRRRRPLPATSMVDETSFSSRRSMQDPNTSGIMAEMKMSLATTQLKDQVKESILLWKRFLDEYVKEVDRIKRYVGSDILQNIWRTKIEFHDKHKGGKENSQKFALQSIKLESCLSQVDDAMQMLIEAWSSDNGGYNSRWCHLEKVRANGKLVVDLSEKSTTSEAACKGLLDELVELEKLIGRKSSTGNTSHQFEKRQGQSKMAERPDKDTEPATSNAQEDGETYEQAELVDSHDQPEPNEDNCGQPVEENEQDSANYNQQDDVNWQESGEQDSSRSW
jgi:hypothetical protein